MLSTNYTRRDQLDRVASAIILLSMQGKTVDTNNILGYTLHLKSEDISESRWVAMIISEANA